VLNTILPASARGTGSGDEKRRESRRRSDRSRSRHIILRALSARFPPCSRRAARVLMDCPLVVGLVVVFGSGRAESRMAAQRERNRAELGATLRAFRPVTCVNSRSAVLPRATLTSALVSIV